MRALTITNESVTRETLLEMAERIPGAWIGIRIAALLLLLEGWKSSQIARLFGLTRWSVVRWIQRANEKGILGVEAKRQPGRPCRLDEQIQRALEEDLEKSPRALGLKRNRWDGGGSGRVFGADSWGSIEGAPSSAMDSPVRIFFAATDLPLCSSHDRRSRGVSEDRKKNS